jgi:hypothetical protein
MTCKITLWNEHGWDLDPEMLAFVMGRVVARHAPQAHTVDVYPQERIPLDAPNWKSPGWLEWIVRVLYVGGGSLTIGCIQRGPGLEFESHT